MRFVQKEEIREPARNEWPDDDEEEFPEFATDIQTFWIMDPAMRTISSSSSIDPTQVVSRICRTFLSPPVVMEP